MNFKSIFLPKITLRGWRTQCRAAWIAILLPLIILQLPFLYRQIHCLLQSLSGSFSPSLSNTTKWGIHHKRSPKDGFYFYSRLIWETEKFLPIRIASKLNIWTIKWRFYLSIRFLCLRSEFSLHIILNIITTIYWNIFDFVVCKELKVLCSFIHLQ